MADGGGLYLWVKPNGGKLSRWAYRFEGKKKLMALGKQSSAGRLCGRLRPASLRLLEEWCKHSSP
jgi:hypothetical protein